MKRTLRDPVKKRQVSADTRSSEGRRCRDHFTSPKKTCFKLGVSCLDYLHDRVCKRNTLPPLAELIRAKAAALTASSRTALLRTYPNDSYDHQETLAMFPTSGPLPHCTLSTAALFFAVVLFVFPASHVHAATNVALGKPVTVTTNGANDPGPGCGRSPADITDGRLDYKPASSNEEDGVVCYVNNDYNQQMTVTAKIDLGKLYNISSIRYNMGDVQFGNTWKPDIMKSPFGTTTTVPGGSFRGAWTTQTGRITASSVSIKFTKTRRTLYEDLLFIGEIEIYGTPDNAIPLGDFLGTKTYTKGRQAGKTYDIRLGNLSANNGKLTGTYSLPGFPGSAPIFAGTKQGNHIQFQVKPPANPSCTHIFSGTLSGNSGNREIAGRFTTHNNCNGRGIWRVSNQSLSRLLTTLWDQHEIESNLFHPGELRIVVPGCTAVAVGQLINYYFQHGYSEGWLDRLLENTIAYPRVGYDHNGNGTIEYPDEYEMVIVDNTSLYNLNTNLLDSYIDRFDYHDGSNGKNIYTDEEQALAEFLLLVGVALDARFDIVERKELRKTGVKFYQGQEPYPWVTDPDTKLESLLVDRFRFRDSIRISRDLATLSEAKQYIIHSIDASLPVLVNMYGNRLDANGNDLSIPAGHTALIDNYRFDKNGRFFIQINMGWGIDPDTGKVNPSTLKWWSGDESIIVQRRGGVKFSTFVILMDTVPINFTGIK